MLTLSHPFARRLRALRSDAARREAEGVFVAEGIHLAIDALTAGAPIEAAVVSPRLSDSEEGRALAGRLRAAGIRTHEANETTIDELQDARSPQPVLLLVKRTTRSLAQVLDGRGGAPPLLRAGGGAKT